MTDFQILTFRIPASLGPGGRAMLKGYAGALVNEVERNGAIDHENAERAYIEAGRADNLRGVLISAPAHIVAISAGTDAKAQAAPFPLAELIEFNLPVSPGKRLSDRDASTLTAYIGILGTVAARGIEREAEGLRYRGDGFWTTLFGPDSDAMDPAQGAAAAERTSDWTDGLTDRVLDSGDRTVTQELLMVRLINILAMIPRVAQHLWMDLYADTMLVADDPQAIEDRPAA